MVQLGSVDNTADSAKPVSSFQLTALNQREYTIAASAPLRKDVSFNLQGGVHATTLSVDPTADISITNLTASGSVAVGTITKRLANDVTVDCDLALGATLLVDTINTSLADQITVQDNVVIGSTATNKNLTLNGNLSITGSISAKPYVSLRVVTAGGTASTNPSGSTLTIGTPGTTSLVNSGYNTTVAVTRGTAGAANAFIYTFTWTGAHPLGASYAVFAQLQTGSTSSSTPIGVITTNTTSSTSFNVWIRATVGTVANVLVDGTFYVHTVP